MDAVDPRKSDSHVHFAITLRVREGKEAEYAESLIRFARQSLEHQGTTGVHLIQPVPGTSCREFGVLRSFANATYCREFYESDMYKKYKAETKHLVDGEPLIRQIDGLEVFFRHGMQRSPPRWKMATVTYIGVVPAVLFWSNMLRPFLVGNHWIANVLIVNAAVVASLAWVMMPLLTSLFQGWLHRD